MKKYLSWIIELFIWLLIILLIVMGVSLYRKVKLQHKHNYHVFFPDANGLKSGSPVKMMGYEIGYVSSVRVINGEEVFVSFIIPNPKIVIPKATTANIEATGLVGSRSIELYPPEQANPNTEEIVIPLESHRVQRAYSDSAATAEIIYNASTHLNNQIAYKEIPFLRKFIQTTAKQVLDIPDFIDKVNDSQDEAISVIKNNKQINAINKQMEKWIK